MLARTGHIADAITNAWDAWISLVLQQKWGRKQVRNRGRVVSQ